MTKDDSETAGRIGARGFFSRRRAELLCALLLMLAAATMLSVVRRKSLTVDELVMIPAGYYHVTAGDFRPVNEHPPFAKVAAALPLLFVGAEAPPVAPPPGYDYGYFLGLFDQFWRANDARYETVTFWARVPAVLTTLLLGALLFVYARRYFGERAAVFAVALFSLEPTVLAHGRVVQTDVPSALAFVVFAFAFYEYLKGPTLGRAAGVGLAAGFAAVTKFSMIALWPVICVGAAALLWRGPRRGLARRAVAAQALALAFAAVLVIHAAYLFRNRAPEPRDLTRAHQRISEAAGPSLAVPAVAALAALHTALPADFVMGVNWQLSHARTGHPASILGRHGTHGWWYYFPVAFALKTTLPFLLLSLASLAWAAVSYLRGRDHRLLALLAPFAFFTGLLTLNTINIGVRYYLPAYAFLFLLGGVFLDRLLGRLGRRKAAGAALVVVLLGWAGLEAARAYPDHMSYFNQLASGRPHWWYLSDSNVEWGDDVRELSLYLRERNERVVGAALLGWQTLERYGVAQADIFVPPGATPERTRYVAVGASLLNGSTVPGGFADGVALGEEERVNYFDRFRRQTPEKVFGGSIYLYRVKE